MLAPDPAQVLLEPEKKLSRPFLFSEWETMRYLGLDESRDGYAFTQIVIQEGEPV